MTTWQNLLNEERKKNNDQTPIEAFEPENPTLTQEDKYGAPQGDFWVAWSKTYVYFADIEVEREIYFVSSVKRHPG